MVIWAQMTRLRYTCICNLSQVKPETILDAIPNAIAALIVHFWRVNTSTPQYHLNTIQSSQESSVYPKCEDVGLHSASKFVQTALMSDTSSRVRAAADLQPTQDVFIIPLMVAATRPDLEQLIREISRLAQPVHMQRRYLEVLQPSWHLHCISHLVSISYICMPCLA